MRNFTVRMWILSALGVVALVLTAQADTLRLKDGRQVQGQYFGGSSSEIQFQVNGAIQVFKTSEVAAIEFGGETMATSSAMASAPASSSQAQSVTIPAGTRLLVRMIDGIDSSKNKVGDVFHASLEDNLTVGNTVVAQKGADVYGRLAEAKSAGHIAGKSELKLELTGIRINGNIQPLVTSDYDVAGKSRGKQSAERIGGGAALGAIIGAIAGGGKGAAIGAGVGAGAGTAIQVITHGDQVRVPSETLLEFRIDQPLTLSVGAGANQ